MSEDATQLLDLQELAIASDDEPRNAKKILIIPVADDEGRVRSRNGDWFLTADDAVAVITAFEGHGADLEVDYEHQSVPGYERPDGRAPAAGWISKLVYEAGKGLFGFIKWTEKARQHIVDREYRYLSPMAIIDKVTRHVVRLGSAGLVNQPAIVDMPAVVAKQVQETDMPEEKKGKAKEKEAATKTAVSKEEEVPKYISQDELLGELKVLMESHDVTVGDEEGAEPIEIIKAAIAFIKSMKSESDSEETKEGEGGEAVAEAASVRKQLGLKAKATTEEVVAAMKATDAHIGFTPNEEVKAMTERVGVLEKESAETKGAALREQYAMKLNPNDKDQMEWAVEASVKDPKGFIRMVAKAPDALAPQGQTGDVPAKTDRETVVANTRAEWRGSPELQQLNPEVETAIYGELREKGLLTADEKTASKFIEATG